MSVLLFIIILLVLIVGHEFGHLIVAKLSGMKVPEFGIGFPPKLWGIKIGTTEYTINALPFGGFVKIVGEDGSDGSDPSAFGKRPKILQAATLVAGPGANVILGVLLFWVALMVGVPAVEDDGSMQLSNRRVIAADVTPNSPAALAGIVRGDTLLSVMLGTTTFPLVTSADLPKYIASSTGDVTLATVHAGVEKSVTLTPVKGVIPTSPDRPAIGIAATAVGMKQLGIVPAFIEAVQQSVYSTYAIIVGLGSLIVGAFTLSASLGDVSGPVGIAGLVGDAATLGWGQVLVLAALISLNLAVVNLLPFPALDGGRLIMVAYEALARKPIPRGVTDKVNTVGFLLLIALMLAVTTSDIFKLL